MTAGGRQSTGKSPPSAPRRSLLGQVDVFCTKTVSSRSSRRLLRQDGLFPAKSTSFYGKTASSRPSRRLLRQDGLFPAKSTSFCGKTASSRPSRRFLWQDGVFSAKPTTSAARRRLLSQTA